MTDDYDRLMDDFGARLVGAEPRAARRRAGRRRATAAGAAAGVAAVTGALVLVGAGGGGGGALDPVAQARAALSPPGQIVHLIVRTRITVTPPMHASRQPMVSEQWAVADPPRWRVFKRMGGRPRIEVSYARGAERAYDARHNTLVVTRGVGGVGAQLLPGTFGSDPVATMRGMLAKGSLHDAGLAHVGAREVRRLVGATRRRVHGVTTSQSTVFDVDPTTFAPLGGWWSFTVAPDGRRPMTTIVRYDVLRYERLPLDATTDKLLTIRTNRTTKVIVRRVRPR